MAFNYSKLRGRIREYGLTQGQLAEAVGINKATLSAKLNNKNSFTTTEIEAIRASLGIAEDEICKYFFAK
jgi:transcriptional regulator with XRE-family HTH domain